MTRAARHCYNSLRPFFFVSLTLPPAAATQILAGHDAAFMELGHGKASQATKDDLLRVDATIPITFAAGAKVHHIPCCRPPCTCTSESASVGACVHVFVPVGCAHINDVYAPPVRFCSRLRA